MGIWGKIRNRKQAVKDTSPSSGTVTETATAKTKPVKKTATQEAVTHVAHTQVTSEYGHRTLIKPLITEKSSHLHAQNHYVLQVANDANKISVAQAIKEVFGVTPTAVRIIVHKGKRVTFRRTQGRRSDTKKAIVTLPKGQSIKVYEGV